MLKRFIPLSISVAALLACAAPAAQATGPLVTNQFGQAAKTITGESTNLHIVTPNGKWECATARLHINVTTNANTTAEGSGLDATKNIAIGTPGVIPHTKHCGSSFAPIHVDGFNSSRIHLVKHAATGVTTGTANFLYTYRVTTIFGTQHCTYQGTNVPVTRTGTDTIRVAGPLVKVNPSPGFLCPGTGEITGDVTVRDEFGGQAHLH